MVKLEKTLVVSILFLVPAKSLAHCPLCTAGAGALAILAASMGVPSITVGVLIGAFAMALGLWVANIIKKQYIKLQKPLISLIIYLSTILPIMPLIKHYYPFYVSLYGEYGSILHNTYTINLFILGSIIGGAIMIASKPISQFISKLNNNRILIPYQGVFITISLLIITSILIQILS